MHKFFQFFLMVLFLVLGILIASPSDNSKNTISQDKLDEFEDYLEENEYENRYIEIIPNIINKTGEKIEGIIDKGFGVVFDIIGKISK